MNSSKEYYGQLVGMKVITTGRSQDGFPFLILEGHGETIRAEVSQDEEGNAPGFLFISTVQPLTKGNTKGDK